MNPRRSAAACVATVAIALLGCGRSDANTEPRRATAKPTTPTAIAPAAPAYKLPQAHPRILLSDQATLARLKKVMDSRSPAAMPNRTISTPSMFESVWL